MAIETVQRVLELRGSPIYVFHEIVHNRHVVESFKSKGVVFVNSIDEIPAGATVVYSAHGVCPEIRRQAASRNLEQVDATCPLVAKVHVEAVRYARQKFTIILIGHRDHDEVVGTFGEAPDCIHIVENLADVEKLSIPADHRVAYLTQTTLSLDDAEIMIAALKQKFPHIKSPARGHLLRNNQSPACGSPACPAGGSGAGGGQRQQLQFPPPGGDRPQPRRAGPPGG